MPVAGRVGCDRSVAQPSQSIGSVHRVIMSAESVLALWDLLAASDVESAWLDGGWGVDALLGEHTRLHRDLDLVVEQPDLLRVVTALRNASFAELPAGRDWNFVMADREGRQVDLHVIRIAADGTGLYGPTGDAYPASSLSGAGRILGRPVRCLTAEYQLESHTGYEHDGEDVQDVLALHRAFGLPLPEQYVDELMRPGKPREATP